MKSLYRYYLMMRPYGPGAIPPRANVVNHEEFSERRFIPVINHNAYAWFDTEARLSQSDVSDYELAEFRII